MDRRFYWRGSAGLLRKAGPHTSAECLGQEADGRPCGALRHLLNEDGCCPAHRPGGREEMAKRGKKGGLATKRRNARPGLDPRELLQFPWLPVFVEGVVIVASRPPS